MGILSTAALIRSIGGVERRLLLTNREIERFEMQHGGIFDVWDQLFGHKAGLRAVHVRDLVALALVGGGMADAKAEAIIADLGPDQNTALRVIAREAIGVAFFPDALVADVKKNDLDGSAEAAEATETSTPVGVTTPEAASATSAA